MKKKIVNVILSVAVVTSMMFTVTACGSKDNDKAPAESAAVTNTVEDAANTDTEGTAQTDTANADTEDTAQTDTANANAEGGMTVEEWVSSEEAAQYVEVLNTTIGAMSNGMMTTEFEGEGNTLSMVFVLSAEALGTDGSDLTDEQKSEMETQMQQQFDGLKDQFQPMRDELKETIGISDLVVQIVYRTSNGTELFRHEL